MTIKELQKEKIITRKTNADRSKALGTLLDTATKIAKASDREPKDEDIITAAKKNIKILSSTIEQNNLGDLEDKYKAEIIIYKEFLPDMVDEKILENKILEIVSALSDDQKNIKSMGRIIGVIKNEYGDSADMSIVSQIAIKALNS